MGGPQDHSAQQLRKVFWLPGGPGLAILSPNMIHGNRHIQARTPPRGPRHLAYVRVGVLAIFVAGMLVAPAAAQDGRRIYDEQLRVRLDQQLPEAREIGVDAGGWFTFAFLNYDDQASRKWRTLREYELRGWTSINVRGVHRGYIRGLLRYDDWNTGDNPNGDKGDDFDEVLERAWYQFDFGQLLKNKTGQTPPVRLRAKVGRAFADIGTALVLSLPLDMVELELNAGNWELMGLLGQTITHTSNIDDSPKVSDHQDRCFWGVELTYNGLDRHRPFVYFLNNQDNTAPWGSDSTQAYEYTSRYVGLGSQGSLTPDLRYQGEIVGEWGKTYSDGVTTGRDDICAMALDAQLEYYLRTATKPKLSVEYLFATGDSDRSTSATSTVGGNLAGTTDHAFNAFGFRDTGLSFAPRMSNLHMYSFGTSFYPLEKHKLFKKMEVGTKVLFYHKGSGSGAVSDTLATKSSQWLGWEWDVFCDWRIASDLTFTIRYGAFRPGAAFEDRTCRQFLYTALTYSF